MGNTSSMLTQYDIEEVQEHCNNSFSQQEIISLYQRFCQLDRNSGGFISANEILSVPEFVVNPLSQGVPADEELKKKARLDRFAAVPKTDSQEEEKKKARALRSASMQQYWLLFSQFYAAVGDFQQPQQPTEAASFAAGFVATSVVFIACSNGA
ncbi:hypothetical protein U1Q18_015387 [Sarracenia purpurea var. burkii]